jgi:glycosyl transferase family 25
VPSLTAGYVIHRRGAQKLVDARIPFGRPVDVTPAAIELDETSLDSSIGAKREERSFSTKWRKFVLKLDYTLRNAVYSRQD